MDQDEEEVEYEQVHGIPIDPALVQHPETPARVSRRAVGAAESYGETDIALHYSVLLANDSSHLSTRHGNLPVDSLESR